MTRVEAIITRVRDTLADPKGVRWSTDRLLRLITEAQENICTVAKPIRKTESIQVFSGRTIYSLPSDSLLFDKCSYEGTLLQPISHSQLDELSSTWESDTGTPTHVVFDKLNRGYIRLYPTPTPSINQTTYDLLPAMYLEDIDYPMSSLYGVITKVELPDTTTSDYGITTGAVFFAYNPCPLGTDYMLTTVSSDYGFVTKIATNDKSTAVSDPTYGVVVLISDSTLDSIYGVITGEHNNIIEFSDPNLVYGFFTGGETTEYVGALKVYYSGKPDDVLSTTATLSVDSSFDTAIKFYVTGVALRDDMDTQNRGVGNEELKLYERELLELTKESTLDFTHNNNKQYVTTYKSGV